MKIRIENSSTTTGRLTGVGYYTKLLSEALGRIEGMEIHAAQFNFLSRKTPPHLDTPSVIEPINFPQKVYAKLHFARIAFPFDLTLSRVDVTIFPNFALWPTIKSRRAVAAVHDLTYVKFPEAMEEKNLHYLRQVVPQAIKKSDLILTVSESVKAEIVEQFGVDPTTIFVTPIPPAEKYFIKSNRPVHNTYKIPTEKYILYGGTIEPRKDVGTLIDAYLGLPTKIQNEYSLVLAGGMGWKSESIKSKLIEAEKRSPNIILTGYYADEDAGALYQQASLYVMPSIYEGFGMPLLEAMAGETPTIASDIPVLREVCGDATVYFKQGDDQELTQKITMVLGDSSLQKELVNKGKDNLKRFSWDDIAARLHTKLKGLL